MTENLAFETNCTALISKNVDVKSFSLPWEGTYEKFKSIIMLRFIISDTACSLCPSWEQIWLEHCSIYLSLSFSINLVLDAVAYVLRWCLFFDEEVGVVRALQQWLVEKFVTIILLWWYIAFWMNCWWIRFLEAVSCAARPAVKPSFILV